MLDIIESRGDFRVGLEVDQYADNPRKEYDHDTVHVITVHTRSWPHWNDIDEDQGPLASHWQRLNDTYGWDDAVDMFERYCRIHGIATLYDTPHEGPRAIWYIMPDMIQQVGDPMEALKADRDEYQAWVDGSTYIYVIEHLVRWARVEPNDGADEGPDDMGTWETVESCGGYYGYKWAEEAAREAFASFTGTNTDRNDHDE